MLLRAEFVALALRMQEMADGKVETSEAGARNSKRDLSVLQAIHDHATSLGANCSMAEAGRGGESARDAFCKAKSLQEALNSLGDVPETSAIRTSCKALFESSLDANTRQELLGLLFSHHTEGSTGQRRERDASGRHDTNGNRESDAFRQLDSREQARASVERETPQKHSTLQLLESTSWGEELQLIESAGREVEIKIIAPGRGSTAFYPAEVLKRDGPNVFKKNTQIYINHATARESAERPAGDWHKLAGALSSDAYWKESVKHGDGLYAKAKFAGDIAPGVLEKAPYSGMSIRANGNAVMEANRPVLKDGVPILKEFTGCESIDVVTRAGAGGMILTEAAVSANPKQESEMDETAVQKLIESAVKSAQAPLLERAIRGDAREEASRILKDITLQEASKARVVDLVLSREIPMLEGALDKVKFAEAVNAEAKREGAYVASLTGAGRVIGMGSGGAAPNPEAETKLREASAMAHRRALSVFAGFGLPETAVKAIAAGYGEAPNA